MSAFITCRSCMMGQNSNSRFLKAMRSNKGDIDKYFEASIAQRIPKPMAVILLRMRTKFCCSFENCVHSKIQSMRVKRRLFHTTVSIMRSSEALHFF